MKSISGSFNMIDSVVVGSTPINAVVFGARETDIAAIPTVPVPPHIPPETVRVCASFTLPIDDVPPEPVPAPHKAFGLSARCAARHAS